MAKSGMCDEEEEAEKVRYNWEDVWRGVAEGEGKGHEDMKRGEAGHQ